MLGIPLNPGPRALLTSFSSAVTEMLRTENRAPSGRSLQPSGRARTASCTRGRPCTAPRRCGPQAPDLHVLGGYLVLLTFCISGRLGPGQGGAHLPWAPACLCPVHLAVALLLQSVEPVKRQPRSQCLSTLVRPVFGEVRARLGVLWGRGCSAHYTGFQGPWSSQWFNCWPGFAAAGLGTAETGCPNMVLSSSRACPCPCPAGGPRMALNYKHTGWPEAS